MTSTVHNPKSASFTDTLTAIIVIAGLLFVGFQMFAGNTSAQKVALQ